MNYLLENAPYDRKPFNQEDVTGSIDVSKLSVPEFQSLMDLKEEVVTGEFFDEAGFFSQFETTDQYYILNIEDELFLVDNQGYDYARYVCRLDNVEVLRAENI